MAEQHTHSKPGTPGMPESGTLVTPDETLPKRREDLLFRKYCLLKQEVWLYIGFYKSHVRNFQIGAGALLAAFYYLLSNPSFQPSASNWGAWLAFGVLICVVANYLLLDVLDALYQLILLGQRMTIIEDQLNRLHDTRVLFWETCVVPRFYGKAFPVRGVPNPNAPFSFSGLMLVIAVGLAVPCLILRAIWTLPTANTASVLRPLVTVAMVFAAALTVYSIYIAFVLLLRMRNRVRPVFLEFSEAPLPKQSGHLKQGGIE